jgi:23S rRNA pseudouridine1911/1915/1917 synthase
MQKKTAKAATKARTKTPTKAPVKRAPQMTILYEDDDFIVVDKPAGLVVHEDGKTDEPTLVDWFVKRYPKAREVGEHILLANGSTLFKSGVVHRLDRDTSGAILLAKHQQAYLHAKEQFQERRTQKHYRAFLFGAFTGPERGIIDRPIGRSKNDFRKWTAQRGARGEMREAVTEYRILGVGKDGDDTYSYIEAHPLTGRTHQIRVHCKAVSHPVVGDALYAAGLYEQHPKALGFSRLALHAFHLGFEAMDGTNVSVEAPLPEDFKKAEKRLKLA